MFQLLSILLTKHEYNFQYISYESIYMYPHPHAGHTQLFNVDEAKESSGQILTAEMQV